MIGLRSRRDERAEASHPGFFGKVPARGDFVSADVDPRFHQEFDRWLQQGMAASREAIGDGWDARFVSAPPWRFVLSAGLCGAHAAAGVFLPSRDRIGRFFPLVVTAKLDGFAGDPVRIGRDHGWFAALEAIAETAAQPDFDLLAFRTKLRRVRAPSDRAGQSAARSQARSVWWTVVEGRSGASNLTSEGMPPPERFIDFLGSGDTSPPPWPWREPDGSSLNASPGPQAVAPPRDSAWRDFVGRASHTPPQAPPTIKADAARAVQRPLAPAPKGKLKILAAVAEHQGVKARFQADAVVVREAPCVLAVVDGVADDRNGVNAARAVVEALAALGAHDTLEALTADLKGKLGRVHSLLRVTQTGQNAGGQEGGASVAVLLQVGARAQVVWVGDVRCYVLRDGMMRCLSRDHVEIGMRRRLSRSVGGAGTAMPDSLLDDLCPGDRFLLCSSPLARILPERGIAQTLIEQTRERACELLVQDAVLGQAGENVTALVADVLPD